jgi:hypothetical protein
MGTAGYDDVMKELKKVLDQFPNKVGRSRNKKRAVVWSIVGAGVVAAVAVSRAVYRVPSFPKEEQSSLKQPRNSSKQGTSNT